MTTRETCEALARALGLTVGVFPISTEEDGTLIDFIVDISCPLLLEQLSDNSLVPQELLYQFEALDRRCGGVPVWEAVAQRLGEIVRLADGTLQVTVMPDGKPGEFMI